MVDEESIPPDSVSEEPKDEVSEVPPVTPIEVKVTNNIKKDYSIFDECDDVEYDEIKLTKEEMDI